MKTIMCASILALSLLGLPSLAAAQTSGSSADGSFSFALQDGLTKTVEFKAITNSDGTTSGRMTFSGPAVFPNQDVDGTGRAGFSGKLENLQIEADFDGLVVDKNRAVMSGTVTGATLGDYIGQRVLLVVEDNGAGIEDKAADKFTWGLYKPAEEGWIPADAELREDNGWQLTWIATDAERKDDEGIRISRSWSINPRSFPLSSYDFAEITDGVGNIQVSP
jgi:hypothetical protein